MRAAWILSKRELSAYFSNPTAYVVISIFLLITGWFFSTTVFLDNVASLRSVFSIVPLIFLFFVPAITMSTFAEERRSGTLELLLTLPVSDWQVIVGKLLSVALLLVIAVGLTLIHTLALSVVGDLDAGATAAGYLGLILLGLAYGSIGIFASSITRNQIVAFIVAFAIIFVLFLFDKVTAFVPGWLAGVVQYLGVDYHYQNLVRGVVDTRDVLYYVSVVVLFGLLTAYNLARRPS